MRQKTDAGDFDCSTWPTPGEIFMLVPIFYNPLVSQEVNLTGRPDDMCIS